MWLQGLHFRGAVGDRVGVNQIVCLKICICVLHSELTLSLSLSRSFFLIFCSFASLSPHPSPYLPPSLSLDCSFSLSPSLSPLPPLSPSLIPHFSSPLSLFLSLPSQTMIIPNIRSKSTVMKEMERIRNI